MLYLDSLPENTKKLFINLSQDSVLSNFYLSGGSGLSLQLNHRQSEDLDFFSAKEFNSKQLLNNLRDIDDCQYIQIEKNTLNLFINQVKLQFLYYPYNLLEEFIQYNNLNISSILDIACTKLITISSRGSKKDFF